MIAYDWHWKPDPDYRRLLKTLRREGDPSTVPFLELLADAEFIADMLGEQPISAASQKEDRQALIAALDQNIRFWYALGYDAIWVEPIVLEPQRRLLAGGRTWLDESAGVITSMEAFELASWPRAEDADFFPFEYLSEYLPSGMGIIAGVRGVLEFAMELMGYETFALALYDQPDLVEAIFAKQAEIYMSVARAAVEFPRVIAMWMGDDMGFKTSTLISPHHLRQHVFPLQRRYAAMAHEHGLPFLLHSCGNLEAVIEDLIRDVKIDAKHSFEDIIMPVEEFSARHGDRLAVIGGVDMDLLTRGTESDVRRRTREIVTRCVPGRGYVLGTGNTVASYIRPQNFLAMLDEGLRYNRGFRDSKGEKR